MKRKIVLATVVASVLFVGGGHALLGCAASPRPNAKDQVEVYETLLAGWNRKGGERQFVGVALEPAPDLSDDNIADCAKGFQATRGTGSGAPLASLKGVKFRESKIELIDAAAWSPADPGVAIAQGKPVTQAVEEGVSRSLITFSQVAFSGDGKDALVDFSVTCGGLCGTGSTVRLHKAAGRWTVVGRCREWIS